MNETAQRREDHAVIHRAVVDRIAAELRPVRRLWPIEARLALWIMLETGVLAALILHGRRPDLAEQLQIPRICSASACSPLVESWQRRSR